MPESKIEIYSTEGSLLGYFLAPQVNIFGQEEYEVKGTFYDASGNHVLKLAFNPQAIPYYAKFQEMTKLGHQYLGNVYVQSGRQPVTMTGTGLIGSLPF